MVTDQYCNIISRGNNKLLSSAGIQIQHWHSPTSGVERGAALHQAQRAAFAGRQTSHREQQAAGHILGSQIIVHMVVHLRDLCLLNHPTAMVKGSRGTRCSRAGARVIAGEQHRARALSPAGITTGHTHQPTPCFSEKCQRFMALPGDLLLLNQQRRFLEHLCFSWRSLISILTRPDIAYL